MGLRVPQITKITQMLKKNGIDLPDGILTVEEAFNSIMALLKEEGKI